jgi:hypothetical protein
MPVTLPPDLAENVAAALRYYPDGRLANTFYRLVRADTPWRAGIPRLLVRAATNAAVSTFDGERPIVIALTGFICSERARLLSAAIAMLRQAMRDVASGTEAKLIYADRTLLVLGGGGGHWNSWDPPITFGLPGAQSVPFGSILDVGKPLPVADNVRDDPAPAPAPAPVSAPAPAMPPPARPARPGLFGSRPLPGFGRTR